jgi:hypothetical protein
MVGLSAQTKQRGIQFLPFFGIYIENMGKQSLVARMNPFFDAFNQKRKGTATKIGRYRERYYTAQKKKRSINKAHKIHAEQS